jgi:DNA-directed DNA polymerase III PolC
MYLNCHTGFSFKYGTLPIEALFEEARRCGVHKLALTEISNTASYMEMLRICSNFKALENGRTRFGQEPYDLDIAMGIEFRKKDTLQYIALARNNQGFEHINRTLSYCNREGKSMPDRAPEFDDVAVIYPFGKIDPSQLRVHEYIGLRHHDLFLYATLPERAMYPGKFVILHPVTFLPPESVKGKLFYRDYNTHRLLRSIANNTLLSKLREHEHARKEEFMIPERDLEALYHDFPELISNTRALLDACTFTYALGTDKNKKVIDAGGCKANDLKYLREETLQGYDRIYTRRGADPNRAIWHERIEKELTIIEQKGFTAYYLIVYDLITYAKQRGFDFVGRGSGANSTVAYCLGITNVDPIALNLYFERFLNEERTSPPDFDIDFSWDNRDDIYTYLFSKYGAHHVCLLGTHVTYQKRSVIRELGKVFGLPRREIDAYAENPRELSTVNETTRLIGVYAEYIMAKKLPSNISIHAGGVIITEAPIYAYTATDTPPKGLPVSHFEMHNAEDFGIFKFDILSQRGLGHIKESIRHIKRNQGIDVDINRFDDFKDDQRIKDLMQTGRAMGCFYVESPAMRMLLGKLRCDDYLTLVAASSIIRPGVASSGMMKAYVERFHMKRNGVAYESIHPLMDELMAETYGVMVYQEDVIKVAHHFAGLTLTQADVLRRGMSGKYRSREEFLLVRDVFFENCKQRGYAEAVINRVWLEIESFSGYSFVKGHSASYAVESYQSLYLKAYFPLEFMVGVINNFGGFYKTEFYFHEARMSGAQIEVPCVNSSDYLTTIYGSTIYTGFVHLKSLESKVAQQIAVERQRNGSYTSLSNFVDRLYLGLEQIRILIRIGAFRFTGKNKQQLLWEAMLHFSQKKRQTPGSALFDTDAGTSPLPPLERDNLEDFFDELELMGFPLGDPFRMLDTKHVSTTGADDLAQYIGKAVTITGYVVTTKDTYTKKGELMHFGTFYDRHGVVFDTLHFPNVAREYPFRGRGFYQIQGKVVEDFGVYLIEVSSMNKLPMISRRTEEFLREPISSPRFAHA